jgi:excisionase family DNA binding protein
VPKSKSKLSGVRRGPPAGRRASAERRAYRVDEFCDAYRVSRDTAYDLMKSGRLRYFHIGSERRIPVEAAEALANQS